MTVPIRPKTSVKAVLILTLLWSPQACAPASTRHRPVETERPAAIEVPPVQGPPMIAANHETAPRTDPSTPPKPGKTPLHVDTSTPLGHDMAPKVADTSTPPEAETVSQPAEAEGGALPAALEGEPAEPAPPVRKSQGTPLQVAALIPDGVEKTPTAKPQPPAPSRKRFLHVVRWKGETLSLIAEWYTGTWKNWEVLAGANPGVDPDRIQIGNRLHIPDGIIKTRDPLPIDFVLPSPGPAEPKNTEPAAAGATSGLHLFGPVDEDAEQAPASDGIELFDPQEIAEASAEDEDPEEPGLFGPME